MKQRTMCLLIILIGFNAFTQEIKITRKNFKTFNNYFYSYEYLNELNSLTKETKYLIKNWVFIDKIAGTPDKFRLVNIHKSKIPEILEKLEVLSASWNPACVEVLLEIKHMLDTIRIKHLYVMEQLNNFSSYEDPLVIFDIAPMVDEGGEIPVYTEDIISKIEIIKDFFYTHLTGYFLPLADEVKESVIDLKAIAVQEFIKSYGLEALASDKKKFEFIYNYYSIQELKDAINTAFVKDEYFYKKYNVLIIKLNTK